MPSDFDVTFKVKILPEINLKITIALAQLQMLYAHTKHVQFTIIMIGVVYVFDLLVDFVSSECCSHSVSDFITFL